MPHQVHAIPARQHPRPAVTVEEADELAARGAEAQAGDGHVTVADIDDVLDEIDSVLEENAEDFVRAFVQKGGQ